MVALIIGGSGSGKSKFAEKLAARISKKNKKYLDKLVYKNIANIIIT